MNNIDSLIFDMDGTLWDAVDSYCKVWDENNRRLGITREPIRRDELLVLMGKPLCEIFDSLVDTRTVDADRYLAELDRTEAELMPILGGKLYPGVKETLDTLSRQGIKLFMVSNCGTFGLDNFLNFTGLRHYFAETLSFGDTGADKDVNIKRLVSSHDLARALYVGDIQRDADSTHAAGIEFIYAAYGFGSVKDPDFTINRFSDLINIVKSNEITD